MWNLASVSTLINKILLLVFLIFNWSCEKESVNKPSSQNPSPMTESIRPHLRVSAETCEGKRIQWKLDDKDVQLFIPSGFDKFNPTHLILHFHGIPKVTEFALCNKNSEVLLTVTGGSGSSSYERLFKKGMAFDQLLNRVHDELGVENVSSLTLSGWSAGYGAIRALISRYEQQIDQVILLDGIHASYIPENQTLFQGGKIDSLQLQPFLGFAKMAVSGEKQMLITHSSIFPGTYASTTECTEFIIQKLELKRQPSLRQGPVGMQQVGQTQAGKFSVLSYAGNTAPDHIDHLHGLSYFLGLLNSP